ncbi:hypothetical protein SLEP1_g7731 [Rubroshorea leprosula]|uniref:Uncharacterized protein n=1 Tax=Rubroshorea leprosula TaxID=152421 RepID=A0AAV5I5D2_9ROSI|nr:hypothetical protein SLEP1_g7731 [Rubroshorea leprosula]
MGEEEEKKRVVVESLGWQKESSITPKKHRAIEGVGASTILELKAQLFKSQEESKKTKELNDPDVEYLRAKRITPRDNFSIKNSGVEARALNYAALERKAELYEKLVRRELSDEQDKRRYCVDFIRRGVPQDGSQQSQAQLASPTEPLDEDADNDTSFLFNTRSSGAEVHEVANQARE